MFVIFGFIFIATFVMVAQFIHRRTGGRVSGALVNGARIYCEVRTEEYARADRLARRR